MQAEQVWSVEDEESFQRLLARREDITCRAIGGIESWTEQHYHRGMTHKDLVAAICNNRHELSAMLRQYENLMEHIDYE